MTPLTAETIKRNFADSALIYERGLSIYQNGAFVLKESDPDKGIFRYEVDGSYGDYTTQVKISEDRVDLSCSCPYPGSGCKHAVAALLDCRDILQRWKSEDESSPIDADGKEVFFSEEEIRRQALEDRQKRAQTEKFKVIEGEMLKGLHVLQTDTGKQYEVTLHDPAAGRGHCSCPDYAGNRLGVCKHLIYLSAVLRRKRDFRARLQKEKFPFFDIYWDSADDRPRLFHERPAKDGNGIGKALKAHFDEQGFFKKKNLENLVPLLDELKAFKAVRVGATVMGRLDLLLQEKQLEDLARDITPPPIKLKANLYPYQKEGVQFGLFKRAALIGDEMGLGKTLQAIALAISKKEVFGFEKVLVVTPASLKEQWKREIERFSGEKADIVEGGPMQRRSIYSGNGSYFKITNYEAVLRDAMLLARFKPDLVILDEAQRIKNFTTKTAEAVKSIPRRHSVVLTGTPLENRLEDVYSIVQFLDPRMLSPLWRFAAEHFMLSRFKKGKILGYRNLDRLHAQLKPIVIRRRKEEVLRELPQEVVNNYYLDLHHQQQKIHSGYLQALIPILSKKYLTPIDLRRIQELLVRMRMVCNSTYLIDRKTHISPKLEELEGIIDEMVVQSGRKMVIFSEWTTMTYLIGRYLSEAAIGFVELSGKVPVKKRHALIDEFSTNPKCRVFLSTDAGGTGLNLQAADCVVNFELPWNPARVRQRIGRVNRIGQKSRCINVVNLITKNSIEEKILTGLQLKTELFTGVFDGGIDTVEFTREKRTELLNQLRGMLDMEPVPLPAATVPSEEIPDDTPHFMNPEVLQAADKREIDVTAEEDAATTQPETAETALVRGAQPVAGPEKMEEVLNSGMAFIGGLLEMATGQKLESSGADGRLLHIDRHSGEVTLKFKLPGFGSNIRG
jgi:superfamily II DNA or RNA helicase